MSDDPPRRVGNEDGGVAANYMPTLRIVHPMAPRGQHAPLRAPVAVLLVAVAPGGCLGAPTGSAPPRSAPALALVDKEGVPRNLTDYARRVLILDFMATWCRTLARKVRPHLPSEPPTSRRPEASA